MADYYSSMTDRELEEKIRTAAEHTAPNNLDVILSLCTDQKRKGGSPEVSYRVILDVNPSVYLEVDEGEKVVRAVALNRDAETFLKETNLCGCPLETAVEKAVEFMLREGYISEMQNSILVSVENSSADRQEEVCKKVSGIVEKAMGESLGGTAQGAAVLSQTVDREDAVLASLAAEYGISAGKAALIQKVVAQDAGSKKGGKPLTFDDLAPLSVNEIALIAQENKFQDDTVTCVGHASEKACIGHRGALEAALSFAGMDMSNIYKQKVKLDVKKGRLIYKVKLKTKFGKYKYYLDAYTGAVVRCKKDGKQGKYLKKYYKKHYKKYYKKHYKKHYKKYYKKHSNKGCELYDPKGVLAAKGGNVKMSENMMNNPSPVSVPEGAIGEQAAKEAALRHAGLTENMVLYVNCQPQCGSGNGAHYDVKFVADGMKYKYAIGMFDGAVLGRAVKNKAEKGKYVYEGNYHEHSAPMNSSPMGSAPTDSAPMGSAQTNSAQTNSAPMGSAPMDSASMDSDRDQAGNMISEQQALDIAMERSQAEPCQLIRRKVKLLTKHGRTIYRYKLKVPGYEYEVDVDAYTGDVVKLHKEVDY